MSRHVLHLAHLSHCIIMWTSSLLILFSHISITRFIAFCLNSSSESVGGFLSVDINVMSGSEQRQFSKKPTSLLLPPVLDTLVREALLDGS